MSQEKVDKYKKDKANRKKIIAKQKRQEFFEKSVITLIGVALVAFIVVSAYFKWFHKEKATVAEAATYSLSEEEISSVWYAYENPTEEETTADDGASEEETVADDSENTDDSENEDSESEDNSENKDSESEDDSENTDNDEDNDSDSNNDEDSNDEDNDEE